MSVSLATMGMFNTCCGPTVPGVGGGGAPPYRREDERIIPLIRVTNMEMKTISIKEQIFKNISIKLISEDD